MESPCEIYIQSSYIIIAIIIIIIIIIIVFYYYKTYFLHDRSFLGDNWSDVSTHADVKYSWVFLCRQLIHNIDICISVGKHLLCQSHYWQWHGLQMNVIIVGITE